MALLSLASLLSHLFVTSTNISINAAASAKKDSLELTENAQLAQNIHFTLRDLTHAFANKDITLSDNKSSKIHMSLKILPVPIQATLDTFIQLTDHLMDQDN